MNKAHHDRKAMESFLDLIEVIKDPEKYTKALDELIETHKQAQEMVELVAPAKEIEKLRSQLRAEKAAELKTIDNANVKARTILQEAERTIDVKSKSIEDRLHLIEDKEQALVERVADTSAKLKAQEEELRSKAEMVEKLHITAGKMLREGKALKEEFTARIEKLRLASI